MTGCITVLNLLLTIFCIKPLVKGVTGTELLIWIRTDSDHYFVGGWTKCQTLKPVGRNTRFQDDNWWAFHAGSNPDSLPKF